MAAAGEQKIAASIRRDAKRFGDGIRRHERESWAFALLVARCVEPGKGQGARQPRRDHDEVGKVSARAFAELAGTSADRVLRYLAAWERAAAAGQVPAAATLRPGDTPELKPALPAWGDCYDASKADAPKQPDSEREQAVRIIRHASPVERRQIVTRVAPELAEAMEEPKVRRVVVRQVAETGSLPALRDAHAKTDEEEQAGASIKASRQAAAKRLPATLATHLWRIVTAMHKWGDDLRFIGEQLDTLDAPGRAKVRDAHVELRDMLDANIALLDGDGTDGTDDAADDSDVIEGTVLEGA